MSIVFSRIEKALLCKENIKTSMYTPFRESHQVTKSKTDLLTLLLLRFYTLFYHTWLFNTTIFYCFVSSKAIFIYQPPSCCHSNKKSITMPTVSLYNNNIYRAWMDYCSSGWICTGLTKINIVWIDCSMSSTKHSGWSKRIINIFL
jgi:hypothetical protein